MSETRVQIAEDALRVMAEGGPQEAFQCSNIAREILAELTRLRAEVARLTEERQAIFLALHPECFGAPGQPNSCHESVCDCFAADDLAGQIGPALESARRDGAERALQEVCPWFSDSLRDDYVAATMAKLFPPPATDTQEPGTQKLYSGVDFWKDDQHPAKADTQGVPFCTSCGLRKAKCDGC